MSKNVEKCRAKVGVNPPVFVYNFKSILYYKINTALKRKRWFIREVIVFIYSQTVMEK